MAWRTYFIRVMDKTEFEPVYAPSLDAAFAVVRASHPTATLECLGSEAE
ncbi:MAG: hypothetical protein AMXMBFR56_65670 [Polyangiaceae bacterium]